MKFACFASLLLAAVVSCGQSEEPQPSFGSGGSSSSPTGTGGAAEKDAGLNDADVEETASGGSGGSSGAGGEAGIGGGAGQGGYGGEDGSAGAAGSGGSAGGGAAGAAGSGGQGGSGGFGPTGTPVGINGPLHICGTHLCNQYSKPVQLRGMSTHGLQWYGWGDCVTESSLDALADQWGADILRVSLYVQEGGYATDPAGFTAQADTIIDAVIEKGMYALIDWHMLEPGDPWDNVDYAKAYFTHMAQRYANQPNVLYEIANEPHGVSWARIKSYAEELIPVIRSYDPDGIVIVGTREWSSFGVSGNGSPDEVINNPVGFDNVMYTFHFYAASHKDAYRNALSHAADHIPVFVTEWGTQEYSGDGPNDFVSSQAFIDLMASKKISWTSWNYSDDHRSGAVFNPGTCPGGPWTGASLKPAGAWVQERISNPPDNFPTL